MRVDNLIKITAEIGRVVFNSSYPSDKILSDFFRQKKQIGSKERKFASNTIYFVFRNYLFLKSASNYLNNKLKIDLSNDFENFIYIGIFYAYNFHEFFSDYDTVSLISKIESSLDINFLLKNHFGTSAEIVFEELKNFLQKLNEETNNLTFELTEELTTIIEQRYSFPKFFLGKIYSSFTSKEELLAFLENSKMQAPIFLRVNTLKSTADKVLETLKKEQIDANISTSTKNALILKQRIQLSELEIFKSGDVEVQDEGSQIISYVLDPQENESILDACAGAGG
jgi:16S rRNA (cytosine967-C5)-methyltransferase